VAAKEWRLEHRHEWGDLRIHLCEVVDEEGESAYDESEGGYDGYASVEEDGYEECGECDKHHSLITVSEGNSLTDIPTQEECRQKERCR